MSDALTVDENLAAAVAVAPRVSKENIEAKMARVSYFTPAKATGQLVSASDSLKTMTICIIEMQNGFTVTGESAPASPENFNEDLGKQFAYENAFRKLWPLEGYLLRERLHLGALEAIAPPPVAEEHVAEGLEDHPEDVVETTSAPETLDTVAGASGNDSVTADAGADTTTAPGSAALTDDPNTVATADTGVGTTPTPKGK